jgi:hypothetical protein
VEYKEFDLSLPGLRNFHGETNGFGALLRPVLQDGELSNLFGGN